jgi:hypothetical protein
VLRYSIIAVALGCTACSTGSTNIDGLYAGPSGATIKLADGHYEFCEKACTSGRVEIRPTGQRAGRVTFYGIPVGAYFRNAQQGPATSLRTWADGVETGYEFGTLGDAYIDIDASHGVYFKRQSKSETSRGG